MPIYKVSVKIRTYPKLIDAKDEEQAREQAEQMALHGDYNKLFDTIDIEILDTDTSHE